MFFNQIHFEDTNGEERYRSYTKSYFEKCNAVLLVFDMNNRKSFDKIRSLDSRINDYVESDGDNLFYIS